MIVEPTRPRIATAEPSLEDLLAGRLPDARGRFGPFGGRYVPETLIPALDRLETQARAVFEDRSFSKALADELRSWVGRPTALTEVRRLGELWGARVFLKREDLAHTGAHKINNALGQALLAQRMGAQRIVAETGAGQHGVATAAACSRVGLPCTVFMGRVDIERQRPNVDRMERLGATVVPVETGDATLRAAIDEALRHWVRDPEHTHYLLGSAVGPHPYPWLVRQFQRIIGEEAREQLLGHEGSLPDTIVACVGGGSNAIGLFHPFLADRSVRLVGVEAGGTGNPGDSHAAPLSLGRPGVLHGAYAPLLQDPHGQIQETASVSAGLDYPGVGPEHAFLQSVGRVEYTSATDTEALSALDDLCRTEGILAALESAHALAGAKRIAEAQPGSMLLIGLSGRGDKDLATLMTTGGPS